MWWIWYALIDSNILGDDSDTLTATTWSIAEAAYGIPEWIQDNVYTYLDEPLKDVLRRWEKEVVIKWSYI